MRCPNIFRSKSNYTKLKLELGQFNNPGPTQLKFGSNPVQMTAATTARDRHVPAAANTCLEDGLRNTLVELVVT